MSDDEDDIPITALLPKNMQLPDGADDNITVSPITGALLMWVWGTKRLHKLSSVQSAYLDSLTGLKESLKRLKTIDEKLDLEHSTYMEKLKYEQEATQFARLRLQKEHEVELARLEKQKSEYAPTTQKRQSGRSNGGISDPDVRAAVRETKRFVEGEAYLPQALDEVDKEVDKLVKMGIITEEQAEEMREKAKAHYRSKRLKL